MQAVSSSDMLDKINKQNHTPFNKEVGHLALNHTQGTPQHKRSFLGHMFNYRFNTRDIYNLSPYSDKISTEESSGPCSHIITEFPTLQALFERYAGDIQSVKVTSDTMAIDSPGQKQTNPDFLATIFSNFGAKLDQALGIKNNEPLTINRVHDCKAGQGIFKHSSRGTIGIITFDKEGKNIQTTSEPITEANLLAYNQKRLKHLIEYIETKKQQDLFKSSINTCQEELALGISGKKDVLQVTKSIEDILWRDIQRHPEFDRSISFVFFVKQTFTDPLELQDEKFVKFHNTFLQLTKNNRDNIKPYNLDKKGDAREIYMAALKAYKDHVDKDIYNKLLYLHANGINLNNYFLDLLSHLNKTL